MVLGTIVFVGCGDGLTDPNFGALLEWSRGALAECRHWHFMLVRSKDAGYWNAHLKGLPVLPIIYGTDFMDLTPYLRGLSDRVQRQCIREPLSLLSEAQTSFDVRWEELSRNREQMSALEYFRQSRILAEMLWAAGGRHRAANVFSNRVMFHGKSLPDLEYIEFSLGAVEWLIDVDLASHASHHLREVEQRIKTADVPTGVFARFRRLLVRCMDALCAYTQALQAIAEALPHASPDERERLKAERSEIHLLQGRLDQAVTDTE